MQCSIEHSRVTELLPVDDRVCYRSLVTRVSHGSQFNVDKPLVRWVRRERMIEIIGNVDGVLWHWLVDDEEELSTIEDQLKRSTVEQNSREFMWVWVTGWGRHAPRPRDDVEWREERSWFPLVISFYFLQTISERGKYFAKFPSQINDAEKSRVFTPWKLKSVESLLKLFVSLRMELCPMWSVDKRGKQVFLVKRNNSA